MQEQTVTLRGQEFHLRTWGDPSLPRLLLLHGFPEFGGSWATLAPLLSEHFYCMAPDQRGFGQSWAPQDVSDYTGSELVADMAALIGDAPVTVLGHDWGAAVAYGLAMFKPELVTRLIIMNGVHPVPFQTAMATGGAQSEASQYINYLRAEGSEDRLSANNFAKLMNLFSAKMDLGWMTTDLLDTYRTEWARPGRMRAMINWYRASPLKVAAPGVPITELPKWPIEKMQVTCPHLLIWGTADTALLPEATEGLENFAADLTRIDIAGADHWLHHSHAPKISQAILSWLNRLP